MVKAMADPVEKRLLDRINSDLKWRSEKFRLGRKTYDHKEMGELLANIRRRKGYRFKPALVPADPEDSDITDHAESSEDSDENSEEADKIGDKYLDKLSTDESEDEGAIGDKYLIGDSAEDEEEDEEDKTQSYHLQWENAPLYKYNTIK
jgi:hypothetical protein